MFDQFIHEHFTLYLLVANPLLGVCLGWFGRVFMGVFGKENKPVACAISGFVCMSFWMCLAWSQNAVLSPPGVDFMAVVLHFGAALVIAPLFAAYLAKRYRRGINPL